MHHTPWQRRLPGASPRHAPLARSLLGRSRPPRHRQLVIHFALSDATLTKLRLLTSQRRVLAERSWDPWRDAIVPRNHRYDPAHDPRPPVYRARWGLPDPASSPPTSVGEGWRLPAGRRGLAEDSSWPGFTDMLQKIQGVISVVCGAITLVGSLATSLSGKALAWASKKVTERAQVRGGPRGPWQPAAAHARRCVRAFTPRRSPNPLRTRLYFQGLSDFLVWTGFWHANMASSFWVGGRPVSWRYRMTCDRGQRGARPLVGPQPPASRPPHAPATHLP